MDLPVDNYFLGLFNQQNMCPILNGYIQSYNHLKLKMSG